MFNDNARSCVTRKWCFWSLISGCSEKSWGWWSIILRAQILDCRSLGRLNFISRRLIFYGFSEWYLLHITFWCPDFWKIFARYIWVFEAFPFLLTVPFPSSPPGRLLIVNIITTKIDATRSYRWLQGGSVKGAIHSQLNWTSLLCDVIPDGKTE